MKNFPLTKIGFFNPGRLSDEEIEQLFITRTDFFEWLFKRITEEKSGSIPQHYLVIGQRGMGKSTLLVRIAAELRKEPWKKKFIALSFPEEQYNVDKLAKFWLNCLDSLADALDRENDKRLAELDNEIRVLSRDKTIEANAIYEVLVKWAGIIKRRPVLLVDNLNLIFDKLNKDEQHQLRGILMGHGAPILAAASAVLIEQTTDYGAPFYDAFQISYLNKLSFEQSKEVLLNLARLTGNTKFEAELYRHQGRLQALYQLTGGTPRTLAILYPLIQDGFSDKIQTDLDAILDAVTPLYKARFEELAPQLQVVLDAVALHWDPINLETLREITHLENQQLAPQLKRLYDVGWLQKLEPEKAKGSSYEISERFFNIWYLMRRSSRRQKRELYCLTRYLETMYGDDLQEIAQQRMAMQCENPDHIALNLAMADALKDAELSNQLRTKSYNELFELINNDKELLISFKIPDEIKGKRSNELYKRVIDEGRQLNYTEALKAAEELTELNEKNAMTWSLLGYVIEIGFKDFLKAEKNYQKSIRLDEKYAYPWNRLGNLYKNHLGKYLEAEKAYKKAISLNEKYASPWNGLGNLYQDPLGKYGEAEQAYKKAISLDEKYAYPWNGLGNLYQNRLGKYAEAEQAYRKAIELDEKYASPWNGLGNLYKNHLEKYGEGEQAFKKAIELDEKYASPWNALGNLYQDHLGKYAEAEQAYRKAIELDEKFAYPWNALGSLYRNHLGKYSEAEQAYRKAIELDEKFAYPWNGLGNLYTNYLGKYGEAEQAYKKAIELDKKFAYTWNGLGNLYQDHLGKYAEAEQAYKNAVEQDPLSLYPKYNLVYLWRDKMNKVSDARELFNTLAVLVEVEDSHYLNEALFAFYENNIGTGRTFLLKAMEAIKKESLPYNTIDDWHRSAAVIIKLGYGETLLKAFEEKEWNIIMRPFYVAVKALTLKEEKFLNTIAAEVREPARIIIEKIKNHIT